MKIILAILFVCLSSVTILAQPGTLDPSFGNNGIARTSIGGGNAYGKALNLQADGKSVVAGSASIDLTDDIALVRYDIDGSIDHTFGKKGMMIVSVGNVSDVANAAVIQEDGKIIAGGYTTGKYGDLSFTLIRATPDGKADTTFGKQGIVVHAIRNFDAAINAIALQQDGKIIAAGWTSDSLNTDFVVARFNQNGIPDSSFGNNGIVISPIGISDDTAVSAMIQHDGKILVCGNVSSGSKSDIAIIRLNPDGSMDNTFGVNGKVNFNANGKKCFATVADYWTDGKILIAGYCETESGTDMLLICCKSDGAPDLSFGTLGMITIDIGNYTDKAFGLASQNSDKIILAGCSTNENYIDFTVVRINSDGTMDQSFGDGGIVSTPVGSSSDFARSVKVASEGKIISAGYSKNELGTTEFAIVRYLAK